MGLLVCWQSACALFFLISVSNGAQLFGVLFTLNLPAMPIAARVCLNCFNCFPWTVPLDQQNVLD